MSKRGSEGVSVLSCGQGGAGHTCGCEEVSCLSGRGHDAGVKGSCKGRQARVW